MPHHHIINPLRHGDTPACLQTRSSLVQGMFYCLSNHYPNMYWYIVNYTPWDKLQCNFDHKILHIFFQENAIKSVVCNQEPISYNFLLQCSAFFYVLKKVFMYPDKECNYEGIITFFWDFLRTHDINSLWQYICGSTLVQVLAWCLMAPSHYLNQCWLIIYEVLWHSPVGNFCSW